MNKHKIRLSKTNSINSINNKEIIGVNLKRTSKLFPDLNVVGEVDAYEVFQSEKADCNNYRLILTINPFCTNVLFNDLTEITRNEGSGNDDATAPDGIECITDEENSTAQYTNGCYGIVNPNRQEMIMNTEYSKESIGYEYKPGYDIFTNHILRNTTYKVVNMLDRGTIQNNGIQDSFCRNELYEDNLEQSNEEFCKRVFNTIGDFMRYSNGDVVMYRKREQIGADVSDELNKHLYLYDEVLSMEDSINNNLTEENGWFGFVNNSTISSKKYTTNTSPITNKHIWEDLDINRVLNNKENCEFIDMYPDRSLFSFNPKLNKFRKRLEYNWNIVLTYPYRNEYHHKVVTSDDCKTNGLLLMSIIKTLNNSGTNILLFRSFCKHGLRQGDMINLYVNGEKLSRSIKVTNVGNMSSNNDDNALYYFYTTDMTLLYDRGININTETNEWQKDGDTITITEINEELNNIANPTDNEKDGCRMRKITSGIESEYYIRVFRKLPNLKNKKENLTEEIAEDRERFENYIYGNGEFENKPNAAETIQNSNNGSFDEYMIDFNSEQYKLAFNRTIYNDASTQITYTDTINTEYLVDNLGRPLHEIYATIIKNNQGYREWYGIDDGITGATGTNIIEYTKYKEDLNLRNGWQTNSNIYFSHCFGRLTSGFEFSNQYEDRNNIDIAKAKAKIGDITTLNELEIFDAKPFEINIDTYGAYTNEAYNSKNYKLQKDEFYGDIVEFNPIQAQEYVLLPICYRFNTAQRELYEGNKLFNKFIYQEIERDDYDPGEGMKVNDILIDTKYDIGNGSGIRLAEWQRPEGYFYQAHYQIPFMEFGQVNQDAHYDIKVKAAQPAQMDGIYIKITTSLKQTISTDDIMYVCLDDEENYRNDKWYEFTVSYVEDKYTFYIHPYNMTWKEFTNKVNDKYNWVTLAMAFTAENTTNEDETISYKNVKLRRRNEAIPKYATKVAHNKYLWRDLYRPGEVLDGELEELPYTNNAFYISKEINFFLKRQDPYGISGLYCSNAVINDVKGNQREEDTYYYKDENEIVC